MAFPRHMPLGILLMLGSCASAMPGAEAAAVVPEAHERIYADLYDLHIALRVGDVVPATAMPLAMAEATSETYFVERSFSMSPNELRGFSFAWPRHAVQAQGDVLICRSATVAGIELRQGHRVIRLR